MKKIISSLTICLLVISSYAQSIIVDKASSSVFSLKNLIIGVNANRIRWQILPGHGRTGSAITAFPVTADEQKPAGYWAHLEYEFYTFIEREFTLNTYHSPALNFHNTAESLQYAILIDDEIPQIISMNKADKNSISGIRNKWVAENIMIKSSKHKISKPGKHIVKYCMVSPGVVLQKLVLDFGDTEQTYLGPSETIHKITSKK